MSVNSLRGAPHAGADNFDSGHEDGRILVVASCDATELLDPIEEAFNEIALVVSTRSAAGGSKD